MLHFLKGGGIIWASKTPFTLYFSLFWVNFPRGDRFEGDCLRHHAVRQLRRFPEDA